MARIADRESNDASHPFTLIFGSIIQGTERFQTNNAGSFSYLTNTVADKSGQWKLQVFALGGSLAGEAESAEVPIMVP